LKFINQSVNTYINSKEKMKNMLSRLRFYNSQGIFNVRRSILLIFGFGIALSSVAGIFFVSNSYSKELIQNSQYDKIDFTIKTADLSYDNFQITELKEMDFWESDIDIGALFPYFTEKYPSLFIFKNYSSISSELRPITYDYVINRLLFYLFDEEFYHSNFPNNLINLQNGSFPERENEIMIDYGFAKVMNLSIGETTSLNIIGVEEDLEFFSNFVKIDNLSYNNSIFNLTITGIYTIENEGLDLFFESYMPIYKFTEDSEEIRVKDTGILEVPILGYHNFSNSKENNSFIKFSEENSFFFQNINHHQGFFGSLEKKSIDFNKLNLEIQRFSHYFLLINQNLPYQYTLEEKLTTELETLYNLQNQVSTQLQLINIPIAVFALLLGSYSIRSNIKGRLKEILLLKSKGTPKRMIYNQVISESFYIGLLSAIIGFLGGISLFFLLRDAVQYAFGLPYFFEKLAISMKLDTFIWVTVISISISEFSSLSSFFYLKTLSTRELLNIIGQDKLNIFYDEKSLFASEKKKNKILIGDTPFAKSNSKVNKEKSSRKKRFLSKLFGRSLYKDTLDDSNKILKKRAWLYLLISIIPLALDILYRYLISHSISDYWESVIPSLKKLFENFYPILLIGTLLFSYGMIRIISVEHPSFFVKFTNKISSFIVGRRSKIASINIIRRKPYITVMVIFGLFISAFSFASIAIQSVSLYDTISKNVAVGGDIRVEMQQMSYTNDPLGEWKLLDNYNIYSNYDIQLLEEEIKNLTIGDSYKLGRDVVTIFTEITNSYTISIYYFDFAKYLKIITEGNKFLPEKSLISKFEDAIKYNSKNTNNMPGIIVNSEFLEFTKLKINDQFDFTHTFWNQTRLTVESEDIETKILNSVDIAPGITGYKQNLEKWEKIVVFFDVNQLGYVNSTKVLHSLKIYQLIDIVPYTLSPTTFKDLCGKQITMTVYSSISVYYQNWNDINDLPQPFKGIKNVISIELLSMGILIAFGLAIIITFTIRNDQEVNGVLLSRGFGKIGVYNLILVELFNIFLIPSCISLIYSLIFTKPLLNILNHTFNLYPVNWNLPLVFDTTQILSSIILIPIISIIIFTIVFSFQTKKSISSFFKHF